MRDREHVQAANPCYKYAARRHGAIDAGMLQLRWLDGDDVTREKRTAPIMGMSMGMGREAGNDVELHDPPIIRRHASRPTPSAGAPSR